MDEETYARMPETLELRLIHVNIHQPGFRTESLDIVTTLTDSEEYSIEEIAELYRRRWLVELDIRSIKCTSLRPSNLTDWMPVILYCAISTIAVIS